MRSTGMLRELLNGFSAGDLDPILATTLRPYQREAAARLVRVLDAEPATPQLLHVATGGGKTLIANEVVKAYLGRHGGPVLWVTKDWRLLEQAAADLCSRDPGFIERIGRIGGAHSELGSLPDSKQHGVVYTTLHTFLRRAGALARGFLPTLVIWDECHWGEDAKTGRRLLAFCKARGIPVLGLTATPRRPERSEFAIAYSKDFASLVREGWLAEPLLHEPFKTGIRWTPRVRNRYSDFTPESLAALGRSRRRNELIVHHYADNAAHYRKTIVFACDIDHANILARMLTSLSGGGIPARPVHSAMPPSEVTRAIDELRRGAVQVLINVAMLTTGIDVPDVKTIFLCRPTSSEILFSQMVGRGSRRHDASGKTRFHIVEFTDNLTKFQEQLVTAKHFFGRQQGSTGRTTPRKHATAKPARRVARTTRGHAFEPMGAPTWIPDHPSIPSSLRGLWYRRGQTFGVELELTSGDFEGRPGPGWQRAAEKLRQALARCLPGRVATQVFPNPNHVSDYSVWNITFDRSAGWEITSRILRDQEGFEELAQACEHITWIAEELGLRVNYRTGLHLHLGWLGRSIEEVKRAIMLVKCFEPALATLVSPSRICEFNGHAYELACPNTYCRPVATVFPRRELAKVRNFDDLWELGSQDAARYVSFNVEPLEELHTVEIRLHNGTTEARKILLWLSLWQQILWAAAHHPHIPNVADTEVIEPSGDIVALAQQYLPHGQPLFLRRLDARRREIAETTWARHPALVPWLMRYFTSWRAPA